MLRVMLGDWRREWGDRKMADNKLKFYSAWFCPFAQRAWIALLAKKADFKYIEHDPYDKTDEWLAISPTGLVPVIVHNGNTVYESSVCIEYVDEIVSSDVSILPQDPFKRAYNRIWGDFITKNIWPPCFGILKKPAVEEREAAKNEFLSKMKQLCGAMDHDGAFFQGSSLGYVDIMLAPFANIFPVLKHYRGFEIPDTPELARFHKWWDTVKRHPAVSQALPPVGTLITRYQKFVAK